MLIFLALAAFAQETPTLTEDATPRTIYQAVTLLEFDKVKVDGKLDGPSTALTIESPPRVHPSLIVLRASFDDEMAASVAHLK